jgi:hypothetical protein
VDGTWDKVNYDDCQRIISSNKTCTIWELDLGCTTYATSAIYYVGYTISLVALILAVIVFMNFK